MKTDLSKAEKSVRSRKKTAANSLRSTVKGCLALSREDSTHKSDARLSLLVYPIRWEANVPYNKYMTFGNFLSRRFDTLMQSIVECVCQASWI